MIIIIIIIINKICQFYATPFHTYKKLLLTVKYNNKFLWNYTHHRDPKVAWATRQVA